MNVIRYNGQLYIRCIPAKTLFHSTMVHEVVNRGDVFAVCVDDNKLTVIPGTAQVEQFDCDANFIAKAPKERPTLAAYKERLAANKKVMQQDIGTIAKQTALWQDKTL